MDSSTVSGRAHLNILMLGWELPPSISGGLGVACDAILRSLGKKAGVRVSFMLPRPVGALGDYREAVEILDVQARDCTEKNLGLIRGSYVACREQSSQYARAVADAVKSHSSFDVIHAHDWLTFEAALAVKRATGTPLVAHVHSTEYDRAGRHGANSEIAMLEATGMREADRIVAVSHYSKRCIIEDYSQDSTKIDVIHNASNFMRAETAASDRADNVCFIGRVTQQKGPEAFVEAASLIHEDMPHVRFVMAGDGNQLPQMRSLARALGVADAFTFPGFIDHEAVRDLLAKCRVLIMPSISEPFGLIGLEAIRAGVPVVLSRNSGLAELVPSALCVDPEDVESIARMTAMLLKDPAMARRYALVLQDEVEHLRWDNSVEQFIRIYGELIGSSDLAGRDLKNARS